MKLLIYLLSFLSVYMPRNIFSHDEKYKEFVEVSSGKIETVVKEEKASDQYHKYLKSLYSETKLEGYNLNYEVFNRGMAGYFNIYGNKLLSEKSILTFIDYTLPSSKKRMWIVDIRNKKVLEHTLVAHGKNTGENEALYFSNKPSSNMSSLGFYVTKGTYQGKHGLSLVIDGVDENYNNNARMRSIVIHGAEYVCENFASKNGRIGRSHGCPAVPMDKNEKIIGLIEQGTCIYVHYKDPAYNSIYLDESTAVKNYMEWSKKTEHQSSVSLSPLGS